MAAQTSALTSTEKHGVSRLSALLSTCSSWGSGSLVCIPASAAQQPNRCNIGGLPASRLDQSERRHAQHHKSLMNRRMPSCLPRSQASAFLQATFCCICKQDKCCLPLQCALPPRSRRASLQQMQRPAPFTDDCHCSPCCVVPEKRQPPAQVAL